MRSVRLDDELEACLKQAAELTGEPISQIIREAVREKCDRLLANRLDLRWADVIGSVRGDGSGYSRRTGRELTKLLEAKHARKKRTK